MDYAQSGQCRWQMVLQHFAPGASHPRCSTCDNCRRLAEAQQQADQQSQLRAMPQQPKQQHGNQHPDPIYTTAQASPWQPEDGAELAATGGAAVAAQTIVLRSAKRASGQADCISVSGSANSVVSALSTNASAPALSALSSVTQTSPPAHLPFAPGDAVRTRRYGKGTVVTVDALSVTVAFKDGEKRSFHPEFVTSARTAQRAALPRTKRIANVSA